jgi:hypothetical protein
MVSPDSLGTACPPSGRNSTYRPVQISETSSVSHHYRVFQTTTDICPELRRLEESASITLVSVIGHPSLVLIIGHPSLVLVIGH